jgi:hypothetical protein
LDGLISELLAELESYIRNEQCADEFPSDTSLADGQSVELAASTYANGLMIYIWQVISLDEETQFIRSDHSDGGVTVFCGGPWQTLKEAKDACGECPEGWS